MLRLAVKIRKTPTDDARERGSEKKPAAASSIVSQCTIYGQTARCNASKKTEFAAAAARSRESQSVFTYSAAAISVGD